MVRFTLFRAQLLLDATTLPFEQPDRESVLRHAVLERPQAITWRREPWAIADVLQLERGELAFRVGSRRKHRISWLAGNTFSESDVLSWPSVWCVLLPHEGVLAVGRSGELRSPDKTAQSIGELLRSTKTVSGTMYDPNVVPIFDSVAFDRELIRAKRIRAFWVELGLPNAFDVDENFYRPQEKAIQAIRAKKAKTTFSGTELDPSQAIEFSKSAATTGHGAGATIENAKGVKKQIRIDQSARVEVEINEPPVRTAEEDHIESEVRKMRPTTRRAVEAMVDAVRKGYEGVRRSTQK